jgi:hypothetical protein
VTRPCAKTPPALDDQAAAYKEQALQRGALARSTLLPGPRASARRRCPPPPQPRTHLVAIVLVLVSAPALRRQAVVELRLALQRRSALRKALAAAAAGLEEQRPVTRLACLHALVAYARNVDACLRVRACACVCVRVRACVRACVCVCVCVCVAHAHRPGMVVW